ncbi:MAG: cytochrome c3 family protein, partial [Steroidobacter sp.]
SRQLPHGQPREVVRMLQEYYAEKYLDPAAARAAAVERRRIPGRDEEQQGCEGPPLVCARQEAARQINIQFNVRGCVSCHQIIDTQSTDILERFQVMPVKLAASYYPTAHFKHRSHLIQGTLSGDDACASCHGARSSKQSEDVMVPGINNCLACHSSRSSDRVADARTIQAQAGLGANIRLGCIECHDYHPAKPQNEIALNK